MFAHFLGSCVRNGNMELNCAFRDQFEHFREENKKSTMTFELQDHKNQALKVEHDITSEFWPKKLKVNFQPKK